MIGTTLAHYRITAALGAGGMGEVWRAEDTKLGREVALKVLSEEFASDPHRLDRFEREARAVAALNHPHIVTIHSVEEADGVRFLTMELVDGQTLDALIPKDGLEIERFFDLATPLAEAVSAAHDKSVIHRDLKPTNVMVDRDGRVKVMDFGLAKVQESGEVSDSSELPTEALTGIGMVVGTVPYMSPEQIEGEIVDHRTDIFSLGVLLYEMAIGERPFQGKSSPSLMSSILKDAPTPVGELRTDLPRHLARIIGRCLEKKRRDRYQTARDVFNELKALQRESSAYTGAAARSQQRIEPAPTAGTVPSSEALGTAGVSSSSVSGSDVGDEGFWIAVLPFKYNGDDADLTALAGGLSEDIGTGLSRFSYLRVIAQGSKVVDARYLLEGSLRQAGAKLRLAVQLVDTTTGAHLWAETYDRTFSPQSLFELQDDLVPRIVSTVADMHGILPRHMSETVRLKPADQLTPYEALLHSFGYNERFTPDSLAEARTCLERAVEQAPGNADCWAMLSLMYSNEYGHYDIRNPGSFDKALEAARKAVLVGPLHTLPHYALAQAHFFRREFPAARTAAERAVSLNPMDGATAAFMGLLIAYSGEWERGCGLAERAWELNPNLPGMYHYTSWHDAYRREDYRRALGLALKLNTPESFYQHAVLTMCYAQLGEMDEAHKSLRTMLAIKPDYGKVARQLHGKWIQPDLVERLMDGLRKAGLEISDDEEQSDASFVRHASVEQRADEGFWVAVLPFKHTGGDDDITVLAEGLTEDIVTGLSRFSYLRVIARSSTLKYASEEVDVRAVGAELGARYILEGSLRRAGKKLRLAVQLVDTDSGAHLWAEAYDRDFDAEDLFALQDGLAPRIVSTVADTHGVLPRSMGEALRNRSPEELSPYEAVLRSFSYFERVTAEELDAARTALELAVQKAPDSADAWAMLALLCAQEYGQGFKLLPDPLESGANAARRAVEAGSSNHLAHFSLAQVLFFQKEFEPFRNAAARAAALNPMDGNSIAFLGELLIYSGDSQRGLELAGRAKRLNPNHPGWYWYADFFHAYRERDYPAALAIAQKVNLPDHWGQQAAIAVACGQLGDRKAAGNALKRLLDIRPDFADIARQECGKWWDPELVESMIEGLRKAGLEIADEEEKPKAVPVHSDSGEQRADEGFWVAVLPFTYTGGDPDITALAEGLSGDIVTGLSRFSYLRVISRGSTLQYASEGADIRSMGEELGARYVMEGALRQAGNTLRVAVQLVDAATGAHLWAENYERTLDAETIFEVQDDLVPVIVSTVADWYGALPHSMSEAVRLKPSDQLGSYEAVLRSFGYFGRISPEEHAIVQAGLERAVEQSPGDAYGWAMLSMMYGEEHRFGFNVQPDPLGRSLQAARRAVDAAPANNIAWLALAQALFFRREYDAFHDAAERAISLNNMDGSTHEYVGHLMAFAGGWERGCEVSERARKLNPNHPGWYWVVHFLDAYRKGDYQAARDYVLKAHHRGGGANFFQLTLLASLYGQLGEQEAAEQTLDKVLSQQPEIALIVREEFGKWYLPELVEQLMDGLRKAGLEIADEEEQPEAVPVLSDSGEQRADEGFWVAVLPFKYTGGDEDLDALAEGLTEDIVTGLARFSYLRVIARGSTTTGARYVMEGSLRRAGNKLRLAVQLVDTVSGAHLWAETYDRDFDPDELFALQDDLVPRIVSTSADHFGVLARAISEAVRGKPVAEMTPYEALMRGFGYHFRLTPEEHAEARDALEQAVEQAPSSADCWAMLAWVYAHEFAHDFNPRSDSLARSLDAARRAVDIAPSNHLAQQVLGVVLFFRKEIAGCRSAAERAMELNPLDGSNEAFFLITFTGEWERGCALIRGGMELNPLHPGWYRAPLGVNEYRKKDFRAAVDEAVKANAPDVFWINIILAAAHSQLGELEAARRALANLLAQKPDFAHSGRQLMGKWFEPELVEHLLDGLRKAGLEERSTVSSSPPVSGDPGSLRHTVGRQSELDDLRAALEAARGGRGSLMCVAGEPGIGKTTLVEDFLAAAVADGGCTVARGRSSERIGDSDAYLPVLEALGSLLQTGEGTEIAQIMKQTAPAWYAQVAPPEGDSDESLGLLEKVKETTPERLKLDFVACVQELSHSRPLILFLDDLHWADESTVDLLSFLAAKFEGSNVLVVATYRPSDMQLAKHPFLQIKPDLQTRGVCRELQLGFLQEPEIAEYLALEFPDHRFPPEFPVLIHEKTEGSPLYMADLVRYLRDQGSIGMPDGEWKLTHGLPEIERELPESVRGMIERKIGQLAEDDHDLLTAASVQGYAFDSAIAARVLGLPPEEIEERLESLERVHAFVKLTGETELPDRTMTLRYRFVHVLYQNALYTHLKPTRKARLSNEVGQALETAHAKNTRKVAHELAALFEAGRDFARAAEHYLTAANQAISIFAHREAATLAKQGLEMVGMLDPSSERSRAEIELQLALGLALRTFRGFGHPETGTAYSRARELCHEIGDAPQLFPVLFGLWEFFQNQGELEAAVDVGEQMLGLAERGDDQGLLVAAHSVMADNLVCVGDPVPATEHAARALTLYEPEEHRSLASLFGYDPAVCAHSLGALALWLAGFPERAVREATAGVALADAFSDPATQAYGPLLASWIRQLTDSAEKAEEFVDPCIALATEFEMPMFRDFGRVLKGWTLISRGEIEKGTGLARSGVDGLEAIEFGWGRSFTLGVVAQGCAAAGQNDEALALVEEAFNHARGTGEHFHEAELFRLKGEFLLQSETLESERCFLQGIEVAQRQEAKSYELRATTSLARLWQRQDRHAEAHEKLDQIYSWFTEGFDTPDLQAAKELLEELTAAMSEKGNEASTQLESADTKSIVVLPFANLSPDPDTEYFSDGLTDEIITDLSRVQALRVISRSSAMRLKDDERDLAAIGRDLDCRYVLEGSVRRAANSLRITARLVDASNDVQLWADKYGGTLDDVFDFQERVSRSIVDALEIQLTPQEAAQLAERPIEDVRAQECYLRARSEIWSFLPDGVDKAVSHLEAGLELIGDNAMLYQGLGEAYFQAINIGAAGGREEEYISKAESCVEKIFALEPDSQRGDSVQAHLQLARGDIQGASRSWRRVLQAFPQDVQALQLSAHIHGWLGGKPDAAAPLVARLLDIDPLDPMSRLMSVTVPLFAGRFSEALEPGRRMFDLDPVTPVWRSNYVMALSYAQRLDEAEALTEGVVAQPDSDIGTWWMGLCRAAWREDRAEVLRLADGPYQQAAAWDAEIPWALASAHAAVGATDEALHWLDRAIDQGMINYPFLSEHDHYLDSIRGDERFGLAMERARREWEQLDV